MSLLESDQQSNKLDISLEVVTTIFNFKLLNKKQNYIFGVLFYELTTSWKSFQKIKEYNTS